MILLIIIVLSVICIFSFWLIRAPHRTIVERTAISDREYLMQLRSEAKQMRCPHPAYKGRHEPCKRAAGRPCVPGCTGRVDININWHG